MARLVFGSSNDSSEITAILPLCTVSVSAERSAPRFIFLLTRIA